MVYLGMPLRLWIQEGWVHRFWAWPSMIEAKVGKASAKDGPLSGALKGRVSLLGLFSSTEKVWEGRVLFL